MPFRDRVKRVFHRSNSASNGNNNGKPNIEYYRRHEVPPSKFRGPFDKEHQKRLAAWSFERAMADRPRSFDLDLSPCATNDLPSHPDIDIDDFHDISADADASDSALSDSAISTNSSRPTHTGSQSSTVVDLDSHSSSMMTLLPETSIYEISDDPIAQLKESIRYTSPIVRALSPVIMSPRGKPQTFSPEDLTRALIAVQLCA